ncbi:hypothetical protein Acr_02g0010520 [Actinidia rufa]|uniref:Protein FAR1-RELATED SEQUENCE n=1 Tax=Actinidia rufa TaxID=165716 RepID=A0A7J0E936_9ERIC|nr:hypothetical protein Acr_02g0010520 [Actinidia rufa]
MLLKSIFRAGMLTVQRSESINAFFDGYVHSKTTLKQFADHYENVLRSKIEKQTGADFTSFNTIIPRCSLIETKGSISTFEVAESVLVKDGIPCKEARNFGANEKKDERGSILLCFRSLAEDIKRGYTAVRSVYDDGNDEQKLGIRLLGPIVFEVDQLATETDCNIPTLNYL